MKPPGRITHGSWTGYAGPPGLHATGARPGAAPASAADPHAARPDPTLRVPGGPRAVAAAGVTLLEVLVAAGLLGLLLGYMAFAWGQQARLARDAREETRMALVAQAQMEMQQENPIHPGDPPFSFTVIEGGDRVEYTGTYGTTGGAADDYWTVTVTVHPRLPGRESFPLAAYVLNPDRWWKSR